MFFLYTNFYCTQFQFIDTTIIYLGDNSEGCLGDNYCPPECTCTGTVVRCSHAKLREIPNGKCTNSIMEMYWEVFRYIYWNKL